MKEVREKKEKGKSRARFWELAGSKMGKVTGVKPPCHWSSSAVVHVRAFVSDAKEQHWLWVTLWLL